MGTETIRCEPCGRVEHPILERDGATVVCPSVPPGQGYYINLRYLLVDGKRVSGYDGVVWISDGWTPR